MSDEFNIQSISTPAYLLNAPFSLSAEIVNNAWMDDMDAAERRVDRSRAFDQFMDMRNRVRFYPEVLPALEKLAAAYPLASITNGNALGAGMITVAPGASLNLHGVNVNRSLTLAGTGAAGQ